MKIRIGEIILLHITILFNHIHVKVTAMNLTHPPTSRIPTPTHTITSILNGMSTIVAMPTHISHGINQTHIGVSSKILVTPSSSRNMIASRIKTANPVPKSSSVSTTVTTSIWSTSTIIPKSPSISHPLSPSTPYPTNNTTSPSPTHKPPKTTSSSQPFVHKVGLIVGVVLGLVVLSVCLIAFHKKETRIKCLKLMCRPCTKNYSSRYNIVPIYVYDDAEQDIRELQDDSDLPLV